MVKERGDTPAFEVHVGSKRYAVYADGRVEGFGGVGQDVIIFNRIPGIIAEALAKSTVGEAA